MCGNGRVSHSSTSTAQKRVSVSKRHRIDTDISYKCVCIHVHHPVVLKQPAEVMSELSGEKIYHGKLHAKKGILIRIELSDIFEQAQSYR